MSVADVVATARLWLGQLAFLLALGATAWALGEAILGRLRLGDPLARRAPLAVALGLVVLGQAVFFLGLAGGLRPLPILALVAVLVAASFPAWRRGGAAVRAAWRRADVRRRAAAGVGAGALTLPFVALALYPAIGFDAVNYHLPYVEAFLAAGRPVAVPALRFPVFPQLAEMLFVVAFVAAGEVAAKLTQTLALLATAGVLVAWGRGPGVSPAGALAAALWLGTPLAVWVGTLAYVDAALALFVVAAVAAWSRALDGADDRGGAWAAMAGAFAGGAAAVKYLGLVFLALLGLGLALGLLRRRRLRPVVLFALAALLVAGPWYVRNAVVTGNPVFPFYTPLFGANDYVNSQPWLTAEIGDRGTSAVDEVAGSHLRRMTGGFGELAMLPWTTVFARERHGQIAPGSPLLLVLLPLALVPALRERRARRLLLVAGLYALFWLTTLREVRFLLPVLPLVYLALGDGAWRLLARLAPSRRRAAAVALGVVCLLPGPLYALYKCAERGPWPVDAAGREAYRARWVPGYEAVRAVEATAGADYSAYVVAGEHLRYLAAGTLVGDWFGPTAYERVLARRGDGRALRRRLDELGVCYVLLPVGRPAWTIPRRSLRRAGLDLEATAGGFLVYRLRGATCTADGPYSWR